jgi:competence protein ComEC
MHRAIASLLAFVSLAVVGSAQTKTANTLDIYSIDVEGGLAALYVSPSGESLLMDTGSPGGRDATRILETLNLAGVHQIDHMVITHYHGDHIGGLEEVAKHIPIKHYYDHGPTIEARYPVENFEALYKELQAKAVSHTVLKPGDRIPFAGIDAVVATSAEQVLKTPIKGAPGAGQPNPACADFKARDESRVDPDNRQSVGIVMSLGQFRVVNLADFTYNLEQQLMCPNNPIGTVDLYMTSHHGIDQSGSPTLVHALQPRVVLMNNSNRKGGAVPTMMTLYTSPRLVDVWQLHWAYAAGMELNAPSLFIANVEDTAALTAGLLNPPTTFGQAGARAPGAGPGAPGGGPGAPGGGPGAPGRGGPGGGQGGHTGPAFLLKVSARPDGSFTVTNTRNNFSKTYPAPR